MLRAHLVRHRIAGLVATPRENNLANYRRMSNREPSVLFGLSPVGSWTFGEVLALMAERVGVSPDPAHRYGQDHIDPDRTIESLDAMAERLRVAAQGKARVVVATGHPEGVFAIHREIARGLGAAGATVLTHPTLPMDTPDHGPDHTMTQVDGVTMLATRGVPVHTHSAQPMRAILDDLAASGEDPPDLVVADHGFAGYAGQVGIEAVGFADSNDPALFVGEAEERVRVSVPLDDNVAPELYGPLSEYLLGALQNVTSG